MERSWVGRRVSVRRVVEQGPGTEERLGDVVGDLIGLDAQTAVIDTRGGLIEVPVPSVVIARLVPASTAAELALETVIARGLRPEKTVEMDGWTLRADHGFTRRANSALPLRQLRAPLTDVLDRARAWYAEHDLPLRICLPTEARRLLDAELGERGWRPDSESHAMIARVDRLGAADHEGRSVSADGSATADETDTINEAVSINDEPDDAWLGLYRGGEAVAEAARSLLMRHDCVTFASLRLDGRTVAVGRAVVDEGWLGLSCVEVDAQYRRQGLATALTRMLANWGRGHEAMRSYVQVRDDNTDAVRLYESLGFWTHHDYRYREDPLTLPG